MNPRILIVDDHEIVREGIRTLFGNLRPGWEICGEASSGSEAVDTTQTLNPDVVILDITMPGVSGLEAASRIRKNGFRGRILMFTMHESESLGGEVRDAGADGYVLKSRAARDLILAVESMLAGKTFFDTPHAPEHTRDEKTDPCTMP